MMNSASSSEPMIVATTAIGSTRMNLPGGARQRQQRQEREDQRRGAAEDGDEDLLRAGERRLRCATCPSRRCRAMFSTTTMESSTSRPSATTKPAIDSWFSE